MKQSIYYSILRHAEQEETRLASCKTTSIVVQWFYIQTDANTGQQRLIKYNAERNKEIEESFKAETEIYEYTLHSDDPNSEKVTYFIDFNLMKTFLNDRISDPRLERNAGVKVYRRDYRRENKCAFPETWEDTRDAQNEYRYTEHNISKADKEFCKISRMFEDSSGDGYIITSITRIQNPFLWKQYQLKKNQIFQDNPPDTVNERFLWHGTKAEAVKSINHYGFNRRYCGENATAYGKGVYFAEKALTSCQLTYAVPDTDDNRHVYFCHVLTGEYQKGTNDAEELPAKPSGGPQAIYDSLVDNLERPSVFVIFHDTQAYPEYLITFKSV